MKPENPESIAQQRAIDLLSELVTDSTVPQALKERIARAFELEQPEILSIARRGLSTAIQMLRTAYEGRPHTMAPDQVEALIDALEHARVSMQALSYVQEAPHVRLPLPGSPDWRRKAQLSQRHAEADREQRSMLERERARKLLANECASNGEDPLNRRPHESAEDWRARLERIARGPVESKRPDVTEQGPLVKTPTSIGENAYPGVAKPPEPSEARLPGESVDSWLARTGQRGSGAMVAPGDALTGARPGERLIESRPAEPPTGWSEVTPAVPPPHERVQSDAEVRVSVVEAEPAPVVPTTTLEPEPEHAHGGFEAAGKEPLPSTPAAPTTPTSSRKSSRR